jgi:hypothetical protein
VNYISALTGLSRLSMLSAKAREHGRETRVSIASQGDAFEGHNPRSDLGKGSSQSGLVEQMATTFRTTRHFGSAQSFAATAPDAKEVLAKDRAVDCSNAAPLRETESRLDRRTCDPARVAQSEWRQISPCTLHHQARVAPAWHDCQTQPAETGVFPKPLQVLSGRLHALDWTCRYLEDGLKIYAFHALNLHTRACTQTIATDKSYETVRARSLQTWNHSTTMRPSVVATKRHASSGSSCGCVCIWASN